MNRSLYAGCLLFISSAVISLPSIAQEGADTNSPLATSACIQTLKKAPALADKSSTLRLQYILYDSQLTSTAPFTPEFEKSPDFNVIEIPNQKDAENFSSCIESALGGASTKGDFYYIKNNSASSMVTDLERIGYSNRDTLITPKNINYLFSDSYQRKYLIDFPNKTYYKLVRVAPPGSIESLGGGGAHML